MPFPSILRQIVFMFTYGLLMMTSTFIADYVLSIHFPSARTDINTIVNKLQTGSITQCCPEIKTKLDYCNMRVANWVANCGVYKYENYSASHPSQCVNCLSRSCVCVNVITLLDPKIEMALLWNVVRQHLRV